MFDNHQYKMYHSFLRLSQTNQKFKLLACVVSFVQFLTCLVLITLPFQPSIRNLNQFTDSLYNIITNKIFTSQNAQISCPIALVLFISLTICVVIKLAITPNFNQIHNYRKLEKVLFYLVYSLSICVQTFSVFMFWSLAKTLLQKSFQQFLLFGTLPIVSYTIINIKFQTISFLKYFTVPLVFILTIFEGPVGFIMMIMVSAYLLLKVPSTILKLLYCYVFLISIFVAINLYIFNRHTLTNSVAFINFSILLVLTTLFVTYKKQQLQIMANSNKIQQILSKLEQVNGQKILGELNFSQFYQIYEEVQKCLLKMPEQTQHFQDKKPFQLTKSQTLQILENYLQRENRTESAAESVNKQIHLLKIKIMRKRPMIEVTNQLFAIHKTLTKKDGVSKNQFFSLYEKVLAKFALMKNEELETARTIFVNQLNEDFQNQIEEFLGDMENFWAYLDQPQISRQKLQNKISKVLEDYNHLKSLNSKIQKQGLYQKQNKSMKLIEQFINAYGQSHKASSESISKRKEVQETEKSNKFFILEKDKIKFVSKELLENLEESSLTYQNMNKQVIFGEQFSWIVDSKILKMDLGSQKQQTILPIFCRKTSLFLKRVSILWYPSLSTNLSYMIRLFDDKELQKQPIMLYHVKGDTLRYFNKQIENVFGIDRQKFYYHINNYQIHFNQLFERAENTNLEENLKNGEPIRCSFYIKKYVQKGRPTSVPVIVKAIRTISVDEKPLYYILKVLEAKKAKTEDLSSCDKRTSTVEIFKEETQNDLKKKWEGEKFFCTIPNPYVNKITEKLAQLEEPGRWSYRYFVHILFFLMACVMLVFLIQEYQFLITRVSSYKQLCNSLENSAEQYTLLFQLYSLFGAKFYMRNFPDDYFKINKVPASIMQPIFSDAENSFLDEFLTRYLKQVNKQPTDKINYSIDFGQYSISTNTDKSTLIDFATAFKQEIKGQDYYFLLQNYAKFRNLTLEFQNALTFDGKVGTAVTSNTTYYLLVGIVMILLFLVICYFFYRLEDSFYAVLEVYQLFPIETLRRYRQSFKSKKQALLNLTDRKKRNKNIDKDRDKETLENSSQNIGSFFSLKQEKNQDLQEGQKRQEAEHFIPKEQDLSTKPRQLVVQPLLIKLAKKSLLFIYCVLIIFILVLSYLSLETEKQGVIQLLDVKIDLYRALLNIKRTQVDAPMASIQGFYFNSSNVEYIRGQVELISKINPGFIFEQMKQFQNEAYSLLTGNLCLIGLDYPPAIPCQSFLEGILTQGLGEAFEMYIENAKIVQTLELSDFASAECSSQYCPPYPSHFNTAIILGESVRYVLRVLKDKAFKCFDSLQKDAYEQTWLKVGGIGLFSVLYTFYGFFLKKKCQRIVSSFRMIPKEIIGDIKVTSYLRKYQILQKLEIL